MFIVWEGDAKLRDKACSSFTKTRKWLARCVERRCFDVTIGADLWAGSLAREELWAMAVQAGSVFGKLRNVRKRVVAFANFLPVPGRKLVT